MAKGLTPFGDVSMETCFGNEFDLLDPQPSMVSIDDIANSLAKMCRFNGHTTRFYSVAEHCVLVASLMENDGHHKLAMAGLMHDAAEAYLGDIISPLKRAAESVSGDMNWVSDLEERINRAIGKKYGLNWVDWHLPVVKHYDLLALKIEAQALTRSAGKRWSWPEDIANVRGLPDGVKWDGGLAPSSAAYAYLVKWEELRG